MIPWFSDNYDIEFVMGSSVFTESVERALTSKKFRTEGFMILELIKKGYIKLIESSSLNPDTDKILNSANAIFIAKENPVNIIHRGEAEVIALSNVKSNSTLLIDERTTRSLIENPKNLQKHLRKKFHTAVNINQNKLNEFSECCGGLKVIRSTELVAFAFSEGYFKDWEKEIIMNIENRRYKILEGLLWGLKLNGCFISENEIKDYLVHLV